MRKLRWSCVCARWISPHEHFWFLFSSIGIVRMQPKCYFLFISEELCLLTYAQINSVWREGFETSFLLLFITRVRNGFTISRIYALRCLWWKSEEEITFMMFYCCTYQYFTVYWTFYTMMIAIFKSKNQMKGCWSSSINCNVKPYDLINFSALKFIQNLSLRLVWFLIKFEGFLASQLLHCCLPMVAMKRVNLTKHFLLHVSCDLWQRK